MSYKLEEFLESLISRKADYDEPMTYQEEEYYNRCVAKSDLLEELIGDVKKLIKDEQQEEHNNDRSN